MRTGLRMLKWMAVSLAAQLLILLAFDMALSFRGRVEVTSASETTVRNASIELPKSASGIRVSHDGMYAAYMDDGSLYIINLVRKKVVRTFSFHNESITCYRWLPDRDMLIYALSPASEGQGEIKVLTYDAPAQTERSYPAIEGLPAGAFVSDIELSTMTNVTYVKVKLDDGKAKVYGFNIMSNLFFASDVGSAAVIKQMVFKDILVWHDGGDSQNVRDGSHSQNVQDGGNSLRVRDGGDSQHAGGGSNSQNGLDGGHILHVWDGEKSAVRELSHTSPFVLLGVDMQDKVYIGELDNAGNVERILSGDPATNPFDGWQAVDLEQAASPGSLVVIPNGTILEVQKERSIIRDIGTKRQVKYRGELIEILGRHIVSMDNGRLRITAVQPW